MKSLEKVPKKHLCLSISLRDYEQVIHDKAKTTCRSLSQYARKMVLGKPVTVYYRDQSYDEFTEAYISFKRDLDVILEKGRFTAVEKGWLQAQIENIKDVVVKLYDHVCENRDDKEHS